MKYSMVVHEFSFNKIKSGSRKIGVHLLDKKAQQIKLHDVLEMHNASTGEQLDCEVMGIAVFDNFDDLIDALTPQALGYENKEEIVLRLNRIYAPELQKELNAVGFFIRPVADREYVRYRPENSRE